MHRKWCSQFSIKATVRATLVVTETMKERFDCWLGEGQQILVGLQAIFTDINWQAPNIHSQGMPSTEAAGFAAKIMFWKQKWQQKNIANWYRSQHSGCGETLELRAVTG
jgi:hypothetical protein